MNNIKDEKDHCSFVCMQPPALMIVSLNNSVQKHGRVANTFQPCVENCTRLVGRTVSKPRLLGSLLS